MCVSVCDIMLKRALEEFYRALREVIFQIQEGDKFSSVLNLYADLQKLGK